MRGGVDVSFHATGFRAPGAFGERFTPYVDVWHATLGRRGLRIATPRTVFTISRRRFADRDGPALAHAALVARIASSAGGAQRLAHAEALDDRLRTAPRPWLCRTLVIGLTLLFLGQLVWPELLAEAAYQRHLVAAGESWRWLSSQAVHDGAWHLVGNAIAIAILGGLVERQLGTARTAVVLVGAAVGTAAACQAAGYLYAVGSSGLGFGAVGALLAMEFVRPRILPAPWRLPRWLLVAALLLDALWLLALPNVGHAGHAGGLLGGGLAALAVAPRRLPFEPPAAWIGWCGRLASVAVVLALVASFLGVADPIGSAARRGERLLDSDAVPPVLLNNHAWVIAISEAPSPEQLALAERMAARAVDETGRRDANLLDTLAEVVFLRGRPAEAVGVIDEAIALRPSESYFREQRRRFTGERAPDDRPDEPQGPGPNLPPPHPWDVPPTEEAPGIRV